MPMPMKIMMKLASRLVVEELEKREYTYDEHKEIERKFNDFYDSVILQGIRIQPTKPMVEPKEKEAVTL